MQPKTTTFLSLIISILCCGLNGLAADTPVKSGIDRSNFDASMLPGQDFFQYVN